MPTNPRTTLVRDYWQGQRAEKDKAFETLWETSLHDGVMAGTALPAIYGYRCAPTSLSRPPRCGGRRREIT